MNLANLFKQGVTQGVEAGLRQLQQERAAEAQAVSQVTQAKVGQILSGLVSDVSPLTEAERREALARLQQQIAAHAQRQPAQASEAQKQLAEWLKQPQFYLAEVQTQVAKLSVLTPDKMALQQTVQLLVRADGQLQLLSLPTPESRGTAAGTGAFAPSEAQVHSLTMALRTALPQQTSIPSLMQFIAKLQAQTGALPSAVRADLVPQRLEQALEQVQAQARTPAQLSQPEALRRTLQTSGYQFEAGLKAALPTAGPRTLAEPKPHVAQPQKGPALGAQAGAPLSDPDLKAVLLQLLHVLQTLPTAGSTSATAKGASDSLIASILGLGQAQSNARRPTGSARTAAHQKLREQVAGALARIQTQQIQSLSQRTGDPGAPVQAHHFELPVRLPDGYGSLTIQIHEHWLPWSRDSEEQRETEPEKDARKKVQQWEVFLEFDLNHGGQLTSHLKIVNGRVSARFWADVAHTRQQAEAQLQNLRERMEENGLTVADVHCCAGAPPTRKVKLNYNLVDVRT